MSPGAIALTRMLCGPNSCARTDFERWTAQELMFHADDLDHMLGRGNIARHYASPGLAPPILNIATSYHVDIYSYFLSSSKDRALNKSSKFFRATPSLGLIR